MLGEDRPLILWCSLLWVAYGLGLDSLSTMACERWVPGCFESNILLLDAKLKFSMFRYLSINFIPFAALHAALAGFLLAAVRRYWIASLPFWFFGYPFVWAGTKNLIRILVGL